ncbi:MAG: sulfoxide reductase heme-binding subunit YedZ [Anaerolineae bacterium]|nr:sulfoxide reductase heme-binding subunit YedZ [Anaerolineae bacterium]
MKTKNIFAPKQLIRLLIHVTCWLPLFVLIFQFFTNNLTANPIQALEQRSGDVAIILLLITLSITPLVTISGLAALNPHRRTLGLYTFFYATIHLLTFIGLDYGFNPALIWQFSVQKPFIWVGLLAFAGLFMLALTSFNYWIKRLGKNWKRLHSLVYVLSFLVVLHFAWAVKGDIFRLAGDIIRPLAAGLVLVFLLLIRVPIVRKWISQKRINLTRRKMLNRNDKKQNQGG